MVPKLLAVGLPSLLLGLSSGVCRVRSLLQTALLPEERQWVWAVL